MKKWLSTIIGLVIITAIWMVSMKADAYSEPEEALHASTNDLLLVPAYNGNDRAPFFFIKHGNNLGAAYAYNGFFGWETDMLSWSPMDKERNYENLSGYQVHGDSLTYGFIRHGDDRLVQINGTDAIILDLEEILQQEEAEELQLDGLYLWYVESDAPINEANIELLNKETEEVLDTISIRQ